mgnify:CR=1 FL=1
MHTGLQHMHQYATLTRILVCSSIILECLHRVRVFSHGFQDTVMMRVPILLPIKEYVPHLDQSDRLRAVQEMRCATPEDASRINPENIAGTLLGRNLCVCVQHTHTVSKCRLVRMLKKVW